jgi:hypothetical protein
MKRTKYPKQNPAMLGTVIDHRGITLSAGVGAFDEALVERFKNIATQAPACSEHIKSETFGEAGPVVSPAADRLPQPHPYQRGDDAV